MELVKNLKQSKLVKNSRFIQEQWTLTDIQSLTVDLYMNLGIKSS